MGARLGVAGSMMKLLGLGHFEKDVSFSWGRAHCLRREWDQSCEAGAVAPAEGD